MSKQELKREVAQTIEQINKEIAKVVDHCNTDLDISVEGSDCDK